LLLRGVLELSKRGLLDDFAGILLSLELSKSEELSSDISCADTLCSFKSL